MDISYPRNLNAVLTFYLLDKLYTRGKMQKFKAFGILSGLFSLIVGCAQTPVTPSSPVAKSGYANVNGIKMYYEIYGPADGIPLILLHGGGSTIDVTWGRILPFLAKNFHVISVEEQGHGRTSDRNAPVQFSTSAEDVAALLRYLKIEKADVFGFSNGASVALYLAIQHPDLIRKLIFASSITKKSGAYPWFWDFMKKADFSNMPQPLKDAYLKVNPDLQKLKAMHYKDADRMRHFQDVPDSEVKKVKAHTLILIGDHELVRPEHAVELSRLIPNSQLLILPGGHGEYLGELIMQSKNSHPDIVAQFVTDFLNAPLPNQSSSP